MNINLSFKFVIAFLALLFVMHEAHEIVHTTVGWLICGDWGLRDFNVWGLHEGCSESKPISILATFAGPAFSFAMMWWGAFMTNNISIGRKSLGFALIFANMPFARILTASFGSGDEVYALNQVLDNYNLAWFLGLTIVLGLASYPLIKGFKMIKNKKIGYFLLFLLAPMAIDIVVVLIGLNGLLNMGILDEYWILGSPKLVSLWTFFVVIIAILCRKHLRILGIKPIK